MMQMNKTKPCKRCKNPFKYNVLIVNDDVCLTCNRMNDLSFWYPRLQRLKFPMPKTEIIYTSIDFSFEGTTLDMALFYNAIHRAALQFGYPVFLRTGYSSNKHSWKDSCFLARQEDIEDHVRNLVEHSALMTIDRMMPVDYWIVREFMECKTFGVHFSGQMPIAKEQRYFVNNGEIVCNHPYWPREAFEKKAFNKKQFEELSYVSPKDRVILNSMAEYVADKFSGAWSLDFLKTIKEGWVLTDMAIAEESYHEVHDKKS